MAFLAQSSDRVEEKLVEERCKAATEEFMVRVSKLGLIANMVNMVMNMVIANMVRVSLLGLIANITGEVDSSPIQIKSITSID